MSLKVRSLRTALVTLLAVFAVSACASSGIGTAPTPSTTRSPTPTATSSPSARPGPTTTPTPALDPSASSPMPTGPTPGATVTATPSPTPRGTTLVECSTLPLADLSAIAVTPPLKPTSQDVACVMRYLYASTRLSARPVKAVRVELNKSLSDSHTWGHTVTTTWDGTTGLIYSPSDTWMPKVYFDISGDLGPEPTTSYDRSVSTVASMYEGVWKYWPKISWSWHKQGANTEWTLSFKQKYGPRTVSATFDSAGQPIAAASSGTESTPGSGKYAMNTTETFAPYTGPPITAH
jgi:hypothetical protein